MELLTESRKANLLITYEHNLINAEKHLAEAEAEVNVCREVLEIVKQMPTEKE